MAKMPWDKYAVASQKTGWVTKKAVRSAKAGKSPRQKLLEAIDKQIADLDKPITKGTWFRPHADGDVVKGQVRYGTKPLLLGKDSTYLEMPSEALSQFYSDLRQTVESGHFDKQLDAISEELSTARLGKK